MKTTEEILSEYSKEIGLFSDISLEALIASHRRQRVIIRSHIDEQNGLREEYRQRIRDEVLSNEYIKVADIKNMTIQEISNLI